MKIIANGLGVFVLIILSVKLIESIPTTSPKYTISTDTTHAKPDTQLPIKPVFTDETLERGIFKQHIQRGEKLNNLKESLGTGACAFDYNNDHWIDLLILTGTGQQHYSGHREWWQSQGGMALYKNIGDGYFEDVTKDSGLDSIAWHMGCLAADLDNDGDQDLFITNHGENQLFKNNGDGSFNEVRHYLSNPKTNSSWSTTAIPVDFDRDGLLDLYIANYIDFSVLHRTLENSAGFEIFSETSFDPTKYNAQQNRLLRNKGGLRFETTNLDSPVLDTSGRSLSAQWDYYDDDLFPDLFVVNDDESPNRLFQNHEGFNFTDQSQKSNLASTQSSRDISGYFDSGSGSYRTILSTNSDNPPVLNSKRFETNITFVDISDQTGLQSPENTGYNGFGIATADFNADGYKDIVQANGYLTPDIHAKSFSQGQANQIWLGNSLGDFTPCDNCLSSESVHSSRSVVTADFDNDGDLDFYISNHCCPTVQNNLT